MPWAFLAERDNCSTSKALRALMTRQVRTHFAVAWSWGQAGRWCHCPLLVVWLIILLVGAVLEPPGSTAPSDRCPWCRGPCWRAGVPKSSVPQLLELYGVERWLHGDVLDVLMSPQVLHTAWSSLNTEKTMTLEKGKVSSRKLSEN